MQLRELIDWPDFGPLRQNLAPLIANALLFGIIVATIIAILLSTKP